MNESTPPASGNRRRDALWAIISGSRPWMPHQLVFLAVAFMVLTCNITFFEQLLNAYPMQPENIGFIASVAGLLYFLLTFLLLPLSHPGVVRPTLVLALLIAAPVSYYQDTFGAIIDPVMIRSILETNTAEARDLLNLELVVRVVVLGILPALFIATRPAASVARRASWQQMFKWMIICGVILVGLLLAFGASYASFFRQHKLVRYYANPIAPVVFFIDFLIHDAVVAETEAQAIGEDARRVAPTGELPRIVILVVGEAVRAQNLGINGYRRDTTPNLARQEIFNFTNVSSCGTATAISVPCLFSALPRADFSVSAARQQENLLDVLQRAGIAVLWRDNNSDSKNVALRVPFEDFRGADNNPLCDPECRDVGMLDGIAAWIDGLAGRDGLLVLHQMGNHGPAYYKRYPPPFEQFAPACQSSELASCTPAEITNAYDNAILYTDHFLLAVIEQLKQRAVTHQTAMLYVSDHGESLGEYGVYLHGLPYSIAPAEQTHVPLILWFSDNANVDRAGLARQVGRPWSHDNVFHTVLDLFQVETGIKQPELSLLRD